MINYEIKYKMVEMVIIGSLESEPCLCLIEIAI